MVEVRGITLPVISIKVNPQGDIEEIKEALEKRLRGNLFKGGYFIIENREEIPPDKLKEIEEFISSLELRSINKFSSEKRKRKEHSRLLIVDRSLRSGQRIEHSGDILILGDVNRDAEVVAVGNIIVMGTLRGIAIAGALGDESAVVVALKMEPQQIRIGRKIAILDDSERISPGYPEIAKIEDGQIILDKI